jgi:serine/threonine protein kinase
VLVHCWCGRAAARPMHSHAFLTHASLPSMQRAVRELRVVQSLQHEHVPIYLAALHEPGTTRLVMRYDAPTCTLLEAIRTSGGLAEDLVRSLVLQIISVLEHLHAQGIVYVVSSSGEQDRGGEVFRPLGLFS